MPKKPIDYKKGLIYKICCADTGIKDIYIGSTTDFVDRKYKHKKSYTKPYDTNHNYYVYQFMRENGGWDNWRMILIEKYPCNDKTELRQREQYWIDLLEPTLNKCRAYSSHEDVLIRKSEYNMVNRDTLNEYKLQYYKDNKELLNQQMKEWYIKNKKDISMKARLRYLNKTYGNIIDKMFNDE